jgi:hypothetical protein
MAMDEHTPVEGPEGDVGDRKTRLIADAVGQKATLRKLFECALVLLNRTEVIRRHRGR